MQKKFKGTIVILLMLCTSILVFGSGKQEAKQPTLTKTEKIVPTAAPTSQPVLEQPKTDNNENQYIIADFEDAALAMRLYKGDKSTLEVEFTNDIVQEGAQAVKVTASTSDWTGIEIVVPKGKGDWSLLRTLKMWVLGSDSGVEVKVVIEDAQQEQFTQSFFDNFEGWKQVALPIAGFKSRVDWQATTATVDGKINYPINFLHYFTSNGGETILYYDTILVTDDGKPKVADEIVKIVEKIVPAYKLKDLAANYDLTVGAAVTPAELKVPELAEVLARDFSTMTAGNEMKFYVIKKDKDVYNFAPADQLMQFATAKKIAMRGHTLVWHSYMPEWLEKGKWSKDELMALLKEYITTVVSRYKGQINVWDVVNEVFDENGTLRDGKTSVWYRVCGEDYIEQAFVWAHAADPAAKLYINDYNVEEVNAKSTGVYNLVKKLLAKGVPVHGFGAQFHLIEDSPPNFTKIYNNVKRFAELGLEVQFTEVDIRIKGTVTEEKLKHQAEMYSEIFNIALAFDKVTNVTTWGVSDAYSWIPDVFPGYGNALLFDRNFNPKPAYNAVQVTLVAGPQTAQYETVEVKSRMLLPFKAMKTDKAPVLDGTITAGEWDASVVYPFAFNQLDPKDQRLPAKTDLDGNWRVLYQGNTLYGVVRRMDDVTITNVANSWENDTLEVFFGIDEDFVQLRALPGMDFEANSYKGKKKVVWSAAGDVAEFSIELPPAALEGKIIGWNIALADNDGTDSRKSQVYPVYGANQGYQGNDFAEIEFVKKDKAGERLGKAHNVMPFKAVSVTTVPVIDGKANPGEWDNAVLYSFAFNQLSSSDLTNPPTADLKGDWRIVYNGKTIYGMVKRTDDVTNISAANSWENDTVEVFFDLNGTFVQLRTLVGKDFEANSYKGNQKAVWSATGDILEFSVELPADSLKGTLAGWNIGLADNDGNATREHQLYPINGTNIGYQGNELGNIQF